MVLRLKDLFQAQDDWDTEYLLSTYHDEFMFIDDYVLMNREEAIDHLLNGVPLENNIWDNQRVAVAETDEVAVWSFVTKTDGRPCKHTHVILKKDGLAWRYMIHRNFSQDENRN